MNTEHGGDHLFTSSVGVLDSLLPVEPAFMYSFLPVILKKKPKSVAHDFVIVEMMTHLLTLKIW
jgi:hypothetical protein